MGSHGGVSIVAFAYALRTVPVVENEFSLESLLLKVHGTIIDSLLASD